MFLVIRDRTEGDSPGDVRGTVLILRTTVYQYHAMRLQRDIRLRRSLVMYYGGMSAIAGDGVEGNVTEQRLLPAKACQLAVY